MLAPRPEREAVEALARRLREESLTAMLDGRAMVSSDGRFELLRYIALAESGSPHAASKTSPMMRVYG